MDKHELPDPGLSVAAVARRLGVAPATLRTWDRRYGLGPGAHAPGAHRRYSAADVARLEAMRQLTVQGVAPADAARLALRRSSRSAGTPPPPAAPAVAAPGRASGSGGRVLRLPNMDARVRGLARASMGLDAEVVTAQLQQALMVDGVVSTWESLLRPVLAAVGERWAATGDGVDVEHLLSQCAGGVFRQHAGVGAPANVRPVLLACAAGELHSLPLDVLAAALAEERIVTSQLGAAVPVRALVSAVRRIGPAALVLWSQLPATANHAQLAAVPTTRPPVAVIAGGPGWRVGSLPGMALLAEDLTSAVQIVGRAVRADGG